MARLLLENIVAENRLDKIRIIDVNNYVIGGQPTDDIDGAFTSSESARDLACTAKYTLDELVKLANDYDAIWNKLKLANPVGMLGNSFDVKVFNNMWLSLNGEYISHSTYPILYDYLLGLDYKPNAQQLIQLPDARALVFRSQNKGRFSDVTEIGIGQYQSDATQKLVGTLTAIYMGNGSTGQTSGPLQSGVAGNFVGVTAGTAQSAANINFDNSRVARTALEERVKAIGVHAQIFIGFSEKLEVLA